MSDAGPTGSTSADPTPEAALGARALRNQARAARKEAKSLRKQADALAPAPMKEASEGPGVGAQLGAIVRCSHPRHAALLALAVLVLTMSSGRGFGAALVAGLAVLVLQLALGLGNDVADEAADRKAGLEGKPLAAGEVPRGNVTYAILVLLLLAVPLALQNGYLSALILLALLLIGGVHNKWLHRGALSWVGWVLSLGLLPAFVAYGAWPGDPHGAAPTWSFTVAAAALGLCLHFATALPDLVHDHAAGSKTLPLRVALRTGAPRLLQITAAATVLALAGLLVAGLTVGIRQ